MTIPIADSIYAPESLEAEEAVIGGVLYDPTAFYSAGFLSPDDFFYLRHQYIWRAFQRLTDRSEPIDLLTVGEELANMNLLNDIGGSAYLMNCVNKTPTSAYTQVYGQMVKRTAQRRGILHYTDKARALALDEEKNIEEVFQTIGHDLFEIARDGTEIRGNFIGDDIKNLVADLKAQITTPDYNPGISFGLRNLDMAWIGAVPEELIIIAGRPGMGKSVLAMNMLIRMLKNTDHTIMYCTTEMSRMQSTRRILSHVSGVKLARLKNANLMGIEDDMRQEKGLSYLASIQNRIYMDDRSGITPHQIKMTALQLKSLNNLGAIIIDGMYLMQSDYDTRGDNHKRYGQIAYALKDLARDLRIPVIAVHQLNRGVENRNDKRPNMADLRESGNIEEAADKIMMVYRPWMYEKELYSPHECQIIAAKHRDGEPIDTKLHFEGATASFNDVIEQTVNLQ